MRRSWFRGVSAHYFGLLQRYTLRTAGEPIVLKKLLYGVRPAVAVEWMRQRNFDALPPMNFLEVLNQTDIPQNARPDILELVETKKVTREMGVGLPPAPLFDFMVRIDARYRAESPGALGQVSREVEEIARTFYREEVNR